jgi:filamentous hemagglutinin family protein
MKRVSHDRNRRQAFVLKTLAAALALGLGQGALAQTTPGLPTNGNVIHGTATINPVVGNTLSINQSSNRAVIDWSTFNIDAGKTVQFIQPSAASATLNRIGDANPSQILGNLSANGSVLLMNPNGITFGATAVVDVAGLIASTGSVNAGRFFGSGTTAITDASGSILNQGAITVRNAGLAALLAPSVRNEGTITATGGTILLAGASAATISLSNGLYEFALTGATGASLANAAGATLNGASITLSTGDAASLLSGVINLEGIQQANAIVVNGNTVELRSALQASSVSGNSNTVNVRPGARVQDAVDIAASGGVVNIGAGDYRPGLVTYTGSQFGYDGTFQQILVRKPLTINGATGARILVDLPTDTSFAGRTVGFTLAADGVTINNMEIAGPLGGVSYKDVSFADYGYLYGVFVGRNIQNTVLTNNRMHDLRTGVTFEGNNTATASGNIIENTKGAFLVRSAGINLNDNSFGTAHNEWDLTLMGSSLPDGAYFTSPFTSTAGYGADMMALSNRNHRMTIADRRYGQGGDITTQLATAGQAAQSALSAGFANRSDVDVLAGRTYNVSEDFNRGDGFGNPRQPLGTIREGIDAVVQGGRVHVRAGTYNVGTSSLAINKQDIAITGDSEAGVIVDARNVASGQQAGVYVTADGVTLENMTVWSPTAYVNGLKLRPATDTAGNITLRHVTVKGGGRSEVDILGVNGAVLDHVSAIGYSDLNPGVGTEGVGISIIDSHDISLSNIATAGNNWGGIGIWTAGRYAGVAGGTSNVSLTGANSLAEANPIYVQTEYNAAAPGGYYKATNLSLDGFAYTVRNPSFRGVLGDSVQYTFFKQDEASAIGLALSLGMPADSSVRRNTGTIYAEVVGERSPADGSFIVGTSGSQAMSIAAAIAASGSGDTIEVRSGSYAESVTLGGRRNLSFGDATLHGLTFNAGAGGSGIGGSVTADTSAGFLFNAPLVLLGDTTLRTANNGNIVFNGDIQNAGGTPRALTLVAGSGAERGDVSMLSGGTQSSPLGGFSVTSRGFTLLDTLYVGRYSIGATANVALSDHTLRATDASATNTISAGGNVSGSTISEGNAQISGGGDVSANVTAQGDASVSGGNVSGNISGDHVVVDAQGSVNAVVTAESTASLSGSTVTGTVTAPAAAIEATGNVQVALQVGSASVSSGGSANLTGSSSSLTVDAPSGSVSGNFGQVANVGTGVISLNGKPQVSDTLSSNADAAQLMPSENALFGRESAKVVGADSSAAGLINRLPATSAGDGSSGTMPIELAAPNQLAEFIQQDQPMEVDLSPRRKEERQR